MMKAGNGATEASFTRRLTKQTEALDPAREEVYETFIRARLLVADADPGGQRVVSVAHEALLNAWPRLRQLLESEVSYLRMRSRVSSAAMQWSEEGRRPERLAAGVTLAESKEVAAREAQLDLTERDFIRLSVRKSRRRLFQLLAGITVLILIFAALQRLRCLMRVRLFDASRKQNASWLCQIFRALRNC